MKMSEYQPLTSKIQVPKEWPLEVGRGMITAVVENVISIHKTDCKVVLTIGDVPAMITNLGKGQGYLLKKVEKINDEETYRIDLILPFKTMLLVPHPRGYEYEEEESKQLLPMIISSDHLISQMIVSNPGRHKVLTAAPILEKILELKGIKGPDIFNHILQTTYRINKIEWINRLQKKSSQSKWAGFSIHTEQVADDKWNVVFNDRLSPF